MNTEILKEVMYSENLTCVVADEEDIIFKSAEKGIVPMLELLELYEKGAIRPVYQADKIIGKAAIIIAARIGIKDIYAGVLSQSAKEIADRKGVNVTCGQLVEMILNPAQTAEGPFEMALHMVDEDDFDRVLETVRKTLEKVRKAREAAV